MMGVLKVLFGVVFGLVLLVPAAIILGVIGLPAVVILAVLAVPVLVVLAVLGLPFLLVLIAAAAVLGVVFAVLGAVLSVGVLLFKLLVFVALPVLAVAWLLKHFASRERREVV
jgi:hypothetical protein